MMNAEGIIAAMKLVSYFVRIHRFRN